jgi:hypothetical protein
MRAIVFNTKQKVAVLAIGLTVATTGVVTGGAAASDQHPVPTASRVHGAARVALPAREISSSDSSQTTGSNR